MQHSLPCRATSAVLAGVVALLPALGAAAKGSRTSVTVAPYAALGGVPPALAEKATRLISGELRTREELELRAAPAAETAETRPAARQDGEKVHEESRAALTEAKQLADAGHHDKAADVLAVAVVSIQSRPAAVDAEGGALLRELLLRLAAERLATSDEDGGDAALAALVRLSPDVAAPMGSFPPAFLRQFSTVQRRTLGQARGAIRVVPSAGDGEARVFLDGRVMRAAPVLIKDVLPGDHFVRVERGGEIWADKVTVLAAAEASLKPQLGAAPNGPAESLRAALGAGLLDQAAVAKAADLARASGAHAVIFGAVLREGDAFAVRSFAYLAKGEKLQQLSRMLVDAEMLGGSLEVLRLSDDAVAKLAHPGAEPLLPLQIGAPAEAAPASVALVEVSAAPPAPVEAPAAEPKKEPAKAAEPAKTTVLNGLVLPALPELPSMPNEPAVAPPPPPAEAPRSVMKPGDAPPPTVVAVAKEVKPIAAEPAVAPAKPVEAVPARDLVIPRSPNGFAEAAPPPAAPLERPRNVEVPTRKLEAVERTEVVAREQPKPARNHTVLWIVAGGLLAAAAGTGGYLLWQSSRTPTTATVNATWAH